MTARTGGGPKLNGRVNVVEQKNAFAAGLKPVHRQRNDFLRRDTVMPSHPPRCRSRINEYPSRKLTLNNVGARQSRNAEKWRNLSGVI